MSLEEIRRLKKWKVSRGIVTHVERKCSLHSKKSAQQKFDDY